MSHSRFKRTPRIASLRGIILLLALQLSAAAADQPKRSVVFTHRQHVEVKGSAHSFDLNKDFTIETWCLWKNFPRDEFIAGDEYREVKTGKAVPHSESGWVLRKRIDKGKSILEFSCASESGRKSVNGPCPEVDEVQHLAVCRAGETMMLWRNGRLIGRASVKGRTLKNSPSSFYLGTRHNAAAGRCFDGEIHAFRLSNAARYTAPFESTIPDGSDEQTIVLFNPFAPNTDHLTDLSGKKHDGILGGARIVDLEKWRADQESESTEFKELVLRLPPLNASMLSFCRLHQGRMVGNGDCWRFCEEAMTYAGAKRRKVYVWGSEVSWQDALPGDVVQFQPTAKAGHHTAIVWRTSKTGNHTLINSNAPPYGRYAGCYQLDFSKFLGRVTIYRPEK